MTQYLGHRNSLNPLASDDDLGGSDGRKFQIRQADLGEGVPASRPTQPRQGHSPLVHADEDDSAHPAQKPPVRVQGSQSTQSRTRLSSSVPSPTTVAMVGDPMLGMPENSPPAPTAVAGSPFILPPDIEQTPIQSVPGTLAVATGAPTHSTPSAAAVLPSVAPSPGVTPPTEKSTSERPTGAAKAGIAIGVLAGVLLVFLLVFFLFNRRKRLLERQRLDDEDDKSNDPCDFPAAAAANQNPNAPRISLRPVTQFLPNLNIDKGTGRGPAANMNAPLAPAAAALGIRNNYSNTRDRSPTSQSSNSTNPFGTQAERIPSSIAEETGSIVSLNEKPLPDVTAAAAAAATATEGAGAGGAAVSGGALTRKASIRKDGPKTLDLTLPTTFANQRAPVSPAETTFSADSFGPGNQTSASTGSASIVAAGGPPNTTVHRVQLDFRPNLEDEMELRAGQLVRLLHEYDDGWALCIRLDRSEQGVVPRTCLSMRPVKPRPLQTEGSSRLHPMAPGASRGPEPMTTGGPNCGPPHPRPESPSRFIPGPRRTASPAAHGPVESWSRPRSPNPLSPALSVQHSETPGEKHNTQPSPPTSNSAPSPVQINHDSPDCGHTPSPLGLPTGPVGRKPLPGQAV